MWRSNWHRRRHGFVTDDDGPKHEREDADQDGDPGDGVKDGGAKHGD